MDQTLSSPSSLVETLSVLASCHKWIVCLDLEFGDIHVAKLGKEGGLFTYQPKSRVLGQAQVLRMHENRENNG